MSDKGNYKAEDAAFGGPYGQWKTFRKWLNYFLTKHGLKPKDLYVYKMPNGEQVVLECFNIIEALLSMPANYHLQMKMMLETREVQGVNIKHFIGSVGGNLLEKKHFDRDPRFAKTQIKVDTGPLN